MFPLFFAGSLHGRVKTRGQGFRGTIRGTKHAKTPYFSGVKSRFGFFWGQSGGQNFKKPLIFRTFRKAAGGQFSKRGGWKTPFSPPLRGGFGIHRRHEKKFSPPSPPPLARKIFPPPTPSIGTRHPPGGETARGSRAIRSAVPVSPAGSAARWRVLASAGARMQVGQAVRCGGAVEGAGGVPAGRWVRWPCRHPSGLPAPRTGHPGRDTGRRRGQVRERERARRPHARMKSGRAGSGGGKVGRPASAPPPSVKTTCLAPQPGPAKW